MRSDVGARSYLDRMDNLGEIFLSSLLQGIGLTLSSFWQAILTNPWLFLIFGGIIAGSLYLRSTPRRRGQVPSGGVTPVVPDGWVRW